MIALTVFQAWRSVQQQLGGGVAWLRTEARCRAPEKDALQLLELWAIGFGNSSWIASDAPGNRRDRAVMIEVPHPSRKRMEERISLAIGQGTPLRLLA